MERHKNKLDLIKEKIKNIDKPLILELGVKEGNSTKMFLEICDKNGGNLISVDILNYYKFQIVLNGSLYIHQMIILIILTNF
jgi:predicted O-methyltransferase YrrM